MAELHAVVGELLHDDAGTSVGLVRAELHAEVHAVGADLHAEVHAEVGRTGDLDLGRADAVVALEPENHPELHQLPHA